MDLSTNQLYWIIGALNESMESDCHESLEKPFDDDEENRQFSLRAMERMNRKDDLRKLICSHLDSLPDQELAMGGVDRDFIH